MVAVLEIIAMFSSVKFAWGGSILELHISKRQSKGLFGGVKLEITSRVELTDEEKKLLKKYKAGNDVLCGCLFKDAWVNITVDKIIKECTSKHSKIEDLNQDEKVINKSYKALEKKLEELKKFEKETS